MFKLLLTALLFMLSSPSYGSYDLGLDELLIDLSKNIPVMIELHLDKALSNGEVDLCISINEEPNFDPNQQFLNSLLEYSLPAHIRARKETPDFVPAIVIGQLLYFEFEFSPNCNAENSERFSESEAKDLIQYLLDRKPLKIRRSYTTPAA